MISKRWWHHSRQLRSHVFWPTNISPRITPLNKSALALCLFYPVRVRRSIHAAEMVLWDVVLLDRYVLLSSSRLLSTALQRLTSEREASQPPHFTSQIKLSLNRQISARSRGISKKLFVAKRTRFAPNPRSVSWVRYFLWRYRKEIRNPSNTIKPVLRNS